MDKELVTGSRFPVPGNWDLVTGNRKLVYWALKFEH